MYLYMCSDNLAVLNHTSSFIPLSISEPDASYSDVELSILPLLDTAAGLGMDAGSL